MEEKSSGLKDKLEEIGNTVKKNDKSKKRINLHTQQPGNLGNHEKTQPMNNRDKGGKK